MKASFQYLLFCVTLFVGTQLLGCSKPTPKVEGTTESTSPDTTSPVGSKDSSEVDAAHDHSAHDHSAHNHSPKPSKSGMGKMGKMKFPAPADMKFKDDIDSNVDAPKNLGELVFNNPDGSKTKLGDFAGKKNVLLVFTEGFNGMLCPFCKTQTSRLVSNYEKFKALDCEVIVVYPGPEDHLDEFVEAALKTEKEQVDKVPFPIVLDKDFAATDYFDIHSMFAHPSTYLIDKKGSVQFAYVGNDMTADRPSVKAMLQRLGQLQE